MTSRSFVVGLALVLAIAATAAVAMYVRKVEENSGVSGQSVQVIVAKQDIIAGERMDELLSDGAFETESLDEDLVVEGAITSLEDLEGKETSSPIVAGEQVTAARLAGTGELPGGTLGIPKGYRAVNIALPAPALLNGDLTAGDHVSLFGHFGQAAQVNAKVNGTQTTAGEFSGTATVTGGAGMTVTLVPDVQVLKVQGTIPTSSGTTASTKFSDVELAVTLALKPRDVEKVIHARQQGQIYVALIPPGEMGKEQRPISFNEVIGR
jgi:Flp pilus assembly protein CpaB